MTEPTKFTPRELEIPGYDIGREVASTAQSAVYHARFGEEDVALKLYAPSYRTDGFVARARREQKTHEAVRHPNVARWLDFGVLPNGTCYLASEWIPGECLETLLRRGDLSEARSLDVVRHVASALAHVHAAGIVHRDVKPSNIVMRESATRAPTLIDFSHALLVGDERLTDGDVVLGTAHYMAPEQAMGLAVDGRADLYALGVVLYRSLTGTFPFDDVSPAEVLRKHCTELPIPPRSRAMGAGQSHAADISQGAEDLCMWLLAKRPQDRVPSARVLEVTALAASNRAHAAA